MPPAKRARRNLSPQAAIAVAAGLEGTSVKLKSTFNIGKQIGKGGYGSINLATAAGKDVNDNAPLVAKIELLSHSPGRLEQHCFTRALLSETTAMLARDWGRRHKVKRSGLPTLIEVKEAIPIGSHFFRITVMKRHGPSLGSIFTNTGDDTVAPSQVGQVLHAAAQLLDPLEWLHSRGYAHADIKVENVCVGVYSASGAYQETNQLFLLDFGIASRFSQFPEKREETHCEYKPLPAQKHNGTLVLTSIDAHTGAAPTRRSDLQVLGYVLLDQLGTMPWWETGRPGAPHPAAIPEKVAALKRQYSNITDAAGLSKAAARAGATKLIKDSAIITPDAASALVDYFTAVFQLGYAARPDYAALRKLLVKYAGGRALRLSAPKAGAAVAAPAAAAAAAPTKPKPKARKTSATPQRRKAAASPAAAAVPAPPARGTVKPRKRGDRRAGADAPTPIDVDVILVENVAVPDIPTAKSMASGSRRSNRLAAATAAPAVAADMRVSRRIERKRKVLEDVTDAELFEMAEHLRVRYGK